MGFTDAGIWVDDSNPYGYNAPVPQAPVAPAQDTLKSMPNIDPAILKQLIAEGYTPGGGFYQQSLGINAYNTGDPTANADPSLIGQPVQPYYGKIVGDTAYMYDPFTNTFTQHETNTGGGGLGGALTSLGESVVAQPLEQAGQTFSSVAEPLAKVGATVLATYMGGPAGAALAAGGINAGNVVAQGGDLGDALKAGLPAAAVAYLGANLAQGLGEGVGVEGAPGIDTEGVFNSSAYPDFEVAPDLIPAEPMPTLGPATPTFNIPTPTAPAPIFSPIEPTPETPSYFNPATPAPSFVPDPSLALEPAPSYPTSPPELFASPAPESQYPSVGEVSGKQLPNGDYFAPKEYLAPPEPTTGYQFGEGKSFTPDMTLAPDYPAANLPINDLLKAGKLLSNLLAGQEGVGGTPGFRYDWRRPGTPTPEGEGTTFMGVPSYKQKGSKGKGAAGVEGPSYEETIPNLSEVARYDPNQLYYK